VEKDIKKNIAAFAAYIEKYPTITLFEIRGIFGTSLFNIIIFLCALPLALFSNQWMALFFASIIIFCDIWLGFNSKLWMPDFIKRLSLSQTNAKKIALWLQKSIPDTFSPSWPHFYRSNLFVICLAAFSIGFIQPAGIGSFLMAISILCVSTASFFESIRASLLGYGAFIVAILL
jgi:hypothetical protein